MPRRSTCFKRSNGGVRVADVLRATARPVLAPIVVAVTVGLALPHWHAAMGVVESLVWLLDGIIMGMSAYAAAVWLLRLGVHQLAGAGAVLLEHLQERLARRCHPSAIVPQCLAELCLDEATGSYAEPKRHHRYRYGLNYMLNVGL